MDPTQQLGQDPDPTLSTVEPPQQPPVVQDPAAPTEPQDPVEQPLEDPHSPQEPSRFERRQERQIERLTDRIAQGMNQRYQPPQQTQYDPLKYNEDEYDVRQLEEDRNRYGEARYQEGLASAQATLNPDIFLDRLERDNDYIASHYKQLDERSDDFNPDLAERLNRLYLATIGFDANSGRITNPGVRYRDYASAFMEVVDHIATNQSADTAQNLARQSSQGGIRPGGSTPRGSGPDLSNPNTIAQMSQEEYQANREAIQAKILHELGV